MKRRDLVAELERIDVFSCATVPSTTSITIQIPETRSPCRDIAR